MKMRILNNLFLTISFCLFITMNSQGQSTPKTYEAAWKKVQALAEKNLPQTALTEVKKIYTLAKKEKQDAQQIKALVYIGELQSMNREDNEVLSIKEMEAALKTSAEPAASVLKNIIARMYAVYYERHRWDLMDRTETVNFNKTDIHTWTANDFHKKITELFLSSLKDVKLLQQTKLDKWEPVIIPGNMRHLRPTLYDLLAHEALDYFQNDERGITKPAYAFEISEAIAFEPAGNFCKTKFNTKDSLSSEYKTLLLFQHLLSFHLQDVKPDALIDADIKRLEYVHQHSTHPDKEQLYLNALENITTRYANNPAAAQALYLQADFYRREGDKYNPARDTSNRYARMKARTICEQIIAQKDSSEGKINALRLIDELNETSFSFKLETVNTPALPFRCFVEYRNLTGLHFRLLKADALLRKQAENQYDEKFWPALLSVTPFKKWHQPLPDTRDLQEHSTEVKIDGLGSGEYILLASADETFGKESLLGARYFYVSSISYINNGKEYFVLDRETGQPIAGASVQVWETTYDNKQSRNVTVKGPKYSTDANGNFRMNIPTAKANEYRYYTFRLDIRTSTDQLFINENLSEYISSYKPNKEEVKSMYFFTDRSLYRPGQTVYLKGIALKKNTADKTGGVLAGYKTTVYLRDANYQDIDSIQLNTSDYGSIQGKFRLPQGSLNGYFSIFTKGEISGQSGFRVEEYKRPKFFVDYDNVKGSYKVNDSIEVTGFAKAYAGNNIDGATVKYRVVRNARFPYPWLFSKWWMPRSDEMEISNGEIKTDKDGRFTIRFKAIPDKSIDKGLEPVFNYSISADVTDINGETRSGEKAVSVSYKSFILDSRIPEQLPAEKFSSLQISSHNLNDEFVPVTLTVSIKRLREEKRLIRNRYWSRPDQFVMTKEEYIKTFPHDEYDQESDMKTWATGETLSTRTDSSRADGQWKNDQHKWEPGFYAVSVKGVNDKGEEISDLRYIELTNEQQTVLNRPLYNWSSPDNVTALPGDTARVKIGTAANDLFVIQSQPGKNDNEENNQPAFSFLRLSYQVSTIDFPVTENNRGGFSTSWAFVINNRFFRLSKNVYVPWDNKDLSIEYLSYRDKTLPGAEEKWKVRITGNKKEAVAAEMLASMYDASLDQFYQHEWNRPYIWPGLKSITQWETSVFRYETAISRQLRDKEYKYVDKTYDRLIAIHQENELNGYWMSAMKSEDATPREMLILGSPINKVSTDTKIVFDLATSMDTSAFNADGIPDRFDPEEKTTPKPEPVQPRKNFNETAFFLPELYTDSTGAIEFSFTMPEALTRWKFMALAHTKEAAFGYSTKEIVTQKELMVQPNPPRFFREGDKMEFSAKIVNLTDKELTGTAQLELVDASTNESVDGWFRNAFPNQYFTVAAGQSEPIFFPIDVPYLFNKALTWRIVARSGNYSDGEENSMPVLTNRMLVTETLPLQLKGSGTKQFTFDKLLNSENSQTLQHQSLTVEYTSNPVWYAVQALPYLTEYPYECAEQSWNRYYANALAASVANSNPKLKAVFDKWNSTDTAALLSNLQKNQELKAVLMEETPWVLEAKTEAAQKKNIALLFDLAKMTDQLNNTFEKFKALQNGNGGFSWFKGGMDDRYITQYIVTGIGHLRKLKGMAPGQETKLKSILAKAIPYLDKKIQEDYNQLVKAKVKLNTYTTGSMVIQYFYMRSFFPDYPVSSAAKKAVDYFRTRMLAGKSKQSPYMQGMIALAQYRAGDMATVKAILKSLKETSVYSEELGRYWKNNRNGWFWYEMPVETQSLLVETFTEAGNDIVTADEIRTWLLKNKQTNNWKTTKATAEACYALLLRGSNWLSSEPVVTIRMGTDDKAPVFSNATAEAGTGYFKKTIDPQKISPDLGKISVSVNQPLSNVTTQQQTIPATWGSVYWQYFEDLDKITMAETPLKLSKKLFVQTNTDRGPVLTPLEEGQSLKVGDKVKVRIELRVDRDMEYVHMKDMRASALEPVNVLSEYKWQGGLGYYETTKDASTSFFFTYLWKGTYVFEYELFATHAGEFSNGISSIQSMYAPEFTAHSEGIRIQIEQ